MVGAASMRVFFPLWHDVGTNIAAPTPGTGDELRPQRPQLDNELGSRGPNVMRAYVQKYRRWEHAHLNYRLIATLSSSASDAKPRPHGAMSTSKAITSPAAGKGPTV